MGELLFVGMGLGDERDLTRRQFDLLKGCDRLFAEEYTATLAPGTVERLAHELGRSIAVLDRAAVEGQTELLDALDRSDRVAFLVTGDPFAATTHVALRLAAEARGHRIRYLPNASIVTAASGFLGLQSYRFGRTVSLPFPEPGFAPTSPLEQIRSNRDAGLHTLVLLDLRPAERRYLTADQALGILSERDPLERFLPARLAIAVVARVGTDSAAAWYGTRADLTSAPFGAPMHALVVPGEPLHFQESEALERVRWPRRH